MDRNRDFHAFMLKAFRTSRVLNQNGIMYPSNFFTTLRKDRRKVENISKILQESYQIKIKV